MKELSTIFALLSLLSSILLVITIFLSNNLGIIIVSTISLFPLLAILMDCKRKYKYYTLQPKTIRLRVFGMKLHFK